MGAQTTKIELKGDKYKAEQLSLAHVDRLLYIFRRNNSFNDLQIAAHREPIFDDTGAFVGEVYMQTAHGAENVIVTCPAGGKKETKELWHKRPEMVEQLVPCMIVTGPEQYSTEIIGYIACLSGSFLEPYVFFPKPENEVEPTTIEGFYVEGFEDYDEEKALDNYKVLSTAGGKTLTFVKPTGTAPDDSRATQGPETGGGARVETWGDVEYVDFTDATWVATYGIATKTLGGGWTSGWELLFDGSLVTTNYSNSPSFDGYYLALVDSYGCSELGQPPPPECFSGREEFKTLGHTPPGLEWIIEFEDIQSNSLFFGDFLDEWPNGAIRLDEALADGAYLTTEIHRDTTFRAWNQQPFPTPYEWTFSSLPCTGCSESSAVWRQDLYITVDNAKKNVTTAYGLGAHYDYSLSSGYGCNVVYHKPADVAIALATVEFGPTTEEGGIISWDTMAFIYQGPAAEDFQGSVSFTQLSDNLDRYIEPPVTLPEGVTGRVRGHIFLGVLRTTKEVQFQVY